MPRKDTLHKWRWRAVTLWIIIFSAAWVWNTISVRDGANSIRKEAIIRKAERDAQLALLATAGHEECVKAFTGMSNVLHLSIGKKRYQQLPSEQKRKVNRLFITASPEANCPPSNLNKKAIQKIRNRGE